MFLCLSVCPSADMEKLGFQRTDFYKNLYLSIFSKSVEKVQVSLKSGQSKEYIT